MKRVLLIPLLLCGHGGFAATRCVPNLSEMFCEGSPLEANVPEAESICTNGAITTEAIMMGMCTTDSYSTMGEVIDKIHISPNPEENTYCWCRLLKPAVSKWVSIDKNPSCDISSCAVRCRLNASGHPTFRIPLMTNII